MTTPEATPKAKIDRKAPCPCGSGRRYKSCCYARDRGRELALCAASDGAAAVDEVLRVFLPLVESRGEHRIACGEGCSACCANFVRCSVPEAMAAAAWLQEPAQAEVRARFEAKLPAWRARAGAGEVAALETHLDAHGDGARAGAAWDEYQALTVAWARKANLCPFNERGRCEIYPVRPLICRSVYVLDSPDDCLPDRAPPKIVSHPALESAFREATRACADAGARLGRGDRLRAIPEAVAAALAHKD
ncbi:MAG TPA: SEC-C metal-binding domain-containing protein [Polyangia bacterium]